MVTAKFSVPAVIKEMKMYAHLSGRQEILGTYFGRSIEIGKFKKMYMSHSVDA